MGVHLENGRWVIGEAASAIGDYRYFAGDCPHLFQDSSRENARLWLVNLLQHDHRIDVARYLRQ